MSSPHGRAGVAPPLPARDLTRISGLWHELSEFPPGENDAALAHLLAGLCALGPAEHAAWAAVVREAAPRRGDPCHGWRTRALRALDAALDAPGSGRSMGGVFDETVFHLATSVLARRAGTRRAVHLPRVAFFIVCPVTRQAEAYFAVRRTGEGPPLHTRARARIVHALQGLASFHRQTLLNHGLLGARQPLSPTERGVQRLLLSDYTEADIARALNLTPAGAEACVSSLFRKLGVRDRAGLAALWMTPQVARANTETSHRIDRTDHASRSHDKRQWDSHRRGSVESHRQNPPL
jgi:DNA-binding CsgD family transcriptional regulator